MANLSIRGVDEQALERLRAAASREGLSLNAYLVGLINRDAGLAGRLESRRSQRRSR